MFGGGDRCGFLDTVKVVVATVVVWCDGDLCGGVVGSDGNI